MDSVGIEEFRIDEDVVSSILQLSNDELEGLTTLYGDSPDDADIELFIFTCFLLFKRTDSPRRAELAIRKAQKWAASTPPDHSQWRRRLAMMRSIRSSVNISWPLIYGDKKLESDVLHILYSGARYRLTGSIEDLNDTINFIGSVLSRTPPIPRLKGMIDLAHWLAQRFEKDRQTYLDDLKAAIRLVRSVASAEGVDYFQPNCLFEPVNGRLRNMNAIMTRAPLTSPLKSTVMHYLLQLSMITFAFIYLWDFQLR